MKAIAIRYPILQRVYTYCVHPLFFAVFFILCLCPLAKAQYYEFNTNLQTAYNHILQLEYQQAQVLLDKQLKVTPKHAIALYLQNLNEIIPIYITEDKNAYLKISKHESLLHQTLEDLPTSSPYYYFTQAEVKLHWAILKLKFGDHTAAALNLRACYKILETGLKKHPDFVPMIKTMALLKIVIGSIPENYTWLAGIVGLHGDLSKGVQQLNAVAKGNTIYHNEAKLWWVICQHYLLGNSEDLNIIKDLRKVSPQNTLYLFLDVSLKVHDAQAEEALEYFEKDKVNAQDFQLIPSFYYMLGEIYLCKGMYNESIKAFNNYISIHKGQAYIKDSYYKIFLAYWLSGNESEAKRYKSLALTKGITRNDSDKQALKMVKSEHFPSKEIYKIRLLTDGGYLKEAIALANKTNSDGLINSSDRTEFKYRLARVYHKSSDVEQAITYYMETIKNNNTSNEYFIPNSCLQLGYIYRDLNQLQKATYYFNKVSTYKHYEYQQTIESKAKAALSSLEK